MKLIHLSDLHLGLRLHGYLLLEDQAYILEQILQIIRKEAPDGVLIGGDIYDKPVPPTEAITLFDGFLQELQASGTKVYVISGNHDSAVRLSFGARLMEGQGVFVSPPFDGTLCHHVLEDDFGPVHMYLLPYVRTAELRRCFPQERIDTLQDGLRAVLAATPMLPEHRNVLLTHQLVLGAVTSEEEGVGIGGIDGVGVELFSCFDYTALGHIHRPQTVGSPTVRYCGTPLAYSFAESGQQKSVSVVELSEKGSWTLRQLPLTPLRPMLCLRGTYAALTERDFYRDTPYPNAYLSITLTDEEDIPDAPAKLRVIYPYLMTLSYDNHRTAAQAQIDGAEQVEKKTPLCLLTELYALQNNQPMSPAQTAAAQEQIRQIWEEDA